jgi:hypothetical protein
VLLALLGPLAALILAVILLLNVVLAVN